MSRKYPGLAAPVLVLALLGPLGCSVLLDPDDHGERAAGSATFFSEDGGLGGDGEGDGDGTGGRDGDATGTGGPDGSAGCPDADEDGVCDEQDACDDGDDAEDADDDTVPDACDACAGHDDEVDADADGRPDGCDCDGFEGCHADADCIELEGQRQCECRDGFSGNGVDVCSDADCGELEAPADGSVKTPDGTGFSAQADYACADGFGLVGVSRRTCGQNGSWSDEAPTCAPGDCDGLTSPDDGLVTTPEGTTTGAEATYSCSDGFELVGVATRTCRPDDSWSGNAPTCTPVDCGGLANPANGSVAAPNGTTFGEMASYSCTTGHDLVGNATRTCRADGTWSGTNPSCVLHDCGGLSNPVDGSVSTAGGTTYGESATYTCDTGYFRASGNAVRNCGENGWSGTAATCQIHDCGSLPGIANGSVSTPDGTTYGETASYHCDPRFFLSGPATRSCGANGAWTGQAPTCPDACVDGLRMEQLSVGSPSYVVIENGGGCTAQLDRVHFTIDRASGADDAFTFDGGTLAAGARLVIGESGSAFDYLLDMSVDADTGSNAMLCAAAPCTSSTVLDALRWQGASMPPALPSGITFDAALRGISSSNEDTERFYRVDTRVNAPAFRTCDWIVAGAEPVFADNFECGDYAKWFTSGGTYAMSTSTGDGSGYAVNQNSGTGISNGLYVRFVGGEQPDYVGIWMRGTDGTTAVMGCASSVGPCGTIANAPFVVQYQDANDSVQAIYGGSNMTGTFVEDSAWFHVEIKNLDWVGKTYDFWVDGVEIATGLAFNNDSGTHLQRLEIFQTAGTNSYWDEVRVW